MSEGGERLVFEAKASRWALPAERAVAGLLCLLGLGLAMALGGCDRSRLEVESKTITVPNTDTLTCLAWLPDSSSVLCVATKYLPQAPGSYDLEKSSRLVMIHVDGTVNWLTSTGEYNYVSASLSPDGTKLLCLRRRSNLTPEEKAYTSREEWAKHPTESLRVFEEREDECLMRLSGNQLSLEAVLPSLAQGRPLDWSPNGKWLVRPKSGSGGMLLSQLDDFGVPASAVMLPAGESPRCGSWSPDSRRVAFICGAHYKPFAREKPAKLYCLEVDSGEVKEIASSTWLDKNGFDAVGWSADSQQLYYAVPSLLGLSLVLYAADVQTGRSRVLYKAHSSGMDYDFDGLQWGADGRAVIGQLAYPGVENPECRLILVSRKGVQPLTVKSGPTLGHWLPSPDCRWLASDVSQGEFHFVQVPQGVW